MKQHFQEMSLCCSFKTSPARLVVNSFVDRKEECVENCSFNVTSSVCRRAARLQVVAGLRMVLMLDGRRWLQ